MIQESKYDRVHICMTRDNESKPVLSTEVSHSV